jgi:bifunctional non-homologous end joining protein LigD
MKKTSEVRVGNRTLSLSNLDKVLYPSGFTKGQVIDYYIRMADLILRHAGNRPLTLKRYPNGVNAGFFYEKECPSHRPGWMKTKSVRRTHHEGEVRYCVLSDTASLAWVANLASIELHVLLSRIDHIDRPTTMVFDFDPGPGRLLLDCAWAATEMKTMLASVGLECFPKSSGKKGIHLYVPLDGKSTFEETKPFAHALALLMERRFPDRIVSKMQKSLREGKILVDWSQNDDHKTTVAPYSLRASPQPTVSAPLAWDEIERALRIKDASILVFEADAMKRRLKEKGDLFEPVARLRQKLPDIGDLRESTTAAERPPRRRAPRRGALAEYNKKRDFKVTPEPSGAPASLPPADGPRFVIQKHAASHLHYDFRLESEGVLKSWAVPKGPSADPDVKRLAMQTEDHPMNYAGFEGVIPEGEYGGGAVMVWDQGTFVNLTQKNGSLVPFERGLEKGHVDFWLKGAKLNGAWSLIRTQGPRHWLLRKKKDAAASTDREPVKQQPDSVLTGRSIERIAADRRSRVWHSNR